MQTGFKRTLRLFHSMSERVPAYKKFLAEHNIDPKAINSEADFTYVPTMDKKNYLRKYPLHELCWDGSLQNVKTISQSSGSTGDPFFWPHGEAQHDEGIELHREIFEKIFGTHNHKTLVVVCFSMGTWIAGPFTMISTIGVSKHHEVLNTVTPGIDKEDAVRSVIGLQHEYDKIIIAGYPPFAKDVYEALVEAGFEQKKDKIKFLFAGENFGEDWREHVLENAQIEDSLHGSVNLYGSADATILGHESPLTIYMRKFINAGGVKRINDVFGQEVLPSLIHYYPERRYFEKVDNKLIFSTDAGLPLMRYDIGDSGVLYKPGELLENLHNNYPEFKINRKDIKDFDYWNNIPMVMVRGRLNLTVSLYGLLIYPENIKAALVKAYMHKWFSGRFTMEITNGSDMEQQFNLVLEAKKDTDLSRIDDQKVAKIVVDTLIEVNSEYRKLLRSVGDVARPIIHIVKNGDTLINQGKIKQQWVKKS